MLWKIADEPSALAAGLTIHTRQKAPRGGREHDIPQPYTAVDTRRVDAPRRPLKRPLATPLWQVPPAERAEFLRAQKAATAASSTATWNTAHGSVAVAEGIKTYTGTCTECKKQFKAARPAYRKGKWPSVCSDGCKKARQRRQGAARVRKHRDQR